ncbi:hypothetical protein OV14_3939 [Ensifer adhaerens OV14]|nr:hypothetical protein OV14_3939 [Ensifer adhaerens OV14]
MKWSKKTISEFLFYFHGARQGRDAVAGLRRPVDFPYKTSVADHERKHPEDRMIKLIDPDHAFYRPLWRRVLIFLVCAGWAALEFYHDQPFFSIIALAIAAYVGSSLLLFYKPTDKTAGAEGSASKDETPKADNDA